MKRFLTLGALSVFVTAGSAVAASFTILNAGQVLGVYPTLSPGAGQTVLTENFNGNVTTFSNFTLTGSSQGTVVRGISNDMFVDQVDRSPSQTTTWALNSLTESIYGWGGSFDLTLGGTGSQLRIIVQFTDNTTAVVAGNGCDTILTPGCTTTALNQYDGLYGWAFTSDTAISAVIIEGNLSATNLRESYTMDDMQVLVGPTAGPGPGVVPEPSSFGLMGLAMVGLGLLRKRRK